ncbi:MAG TPA: hypothetical protein VGQ34_04615, partial [Sphingomicrobium sp.]|nr:hypothetical protein [Sphingomicrobium sp.]
DDLIAAAYLPSLTRGAHLVSVRSSKGPVAQCRARQTAASLRWKDVRGSSGERKRGLTKSKLGAK